MGVSCTRSPNMMGNGYLVRASSFENMVVVALHQTIAVA
ncbi:hypothetical protein KIPB_012433, partial [Kipferlia bialata]|eukprot:g12433.t1